MIQELKRKGNLSPEKIEDLDKGSEATTSILARADQAIDRESRHAAIQELQARVEDWKGHQIENFGDLILSGDHTVLKPDGAKEVEREVRKSPPTVREFPCLQAGTVSDSGRMTASTLLCV